MGDVHRRIVQISPYSRESFLPQDTLPSWFRLVRVRIMEYDGGLSRTVAEQEATKAIRVYCYRTKEKPDSELVAIMPNTSLAEAHESLSLRYGDKLLAVYENTPNLAGILAKPTGVVQILISLRSNAFSSKYSSHLIGSSFLISVTSESSMMINCSITSRFVILK